MTAVGFDAQFTRATAAAGTIAGWMTPGEGALLFSLAAACPHGGTIVEIGSWQGKSTVLLGLGAMLSDGVRIYAIDPHEPYLDYPEGALPVFLANIARFDLTAAVTPLVERSEKAAASFEIPIDVLFIDGDHSEAGVMADIRVWLPKVRTGGAVAFHDVRNLLCPGVSRALARMLWSATAVTDVHLRDSIVWMTRVEHAPFGERMRNKGLSALLALYSLVPGLPKPVISLGRVLARGR